MEPLRKGARKESRHILWDLHEKVPEFDSLILGRLNVADLKALRVTCLKGKQVIDHFMCAKDQFMLKWSIQGPSRRNLKLPTSSGGKIQLWHHFDHTFSIWHTSQNIIRGNLIQANDHVVETTFQDDFGALVNVIHQKGCDKMVLVLENEVSLRFEVLNASDGSFFGSYETLTKLKYAISSNYIALIPPDGYEALAVTPIHERQSDNDLYMDFPYVPISYGETTHIKHLRKDEFFVECDHGGDTEFFTMECQADGTVETEPRMLYLEHIIYISQETVLHIGKKFVNGQMTYTLTLTWWRDEDEDDLPAVKLAPMESTSLGVSGEIVEDCSKEGRLAVYVRGKERQEVFIIEECLLKKKIVEIPMAPWTKELWLLLTRKYVRMTKPRCFLRGKYFVAPGTVWNWTKNDVIRLSREENVIDFFVEKDGMAICCTSEDTNLLHFKRYAFVL